MFTKFIPLAAAAFIPALALASPLPASTSPAPGGVAYFDAAVDCEAVKVHGENGNEENTFAIEILVEDLGAGGPQPGAALLKFAAGPSGPGTHAAPEFSVFTGTLDPASSAAIMFQSEGRNGRLAIRRGESGKTLKLETRDGDTGKWSTYYEGPIHCTFFQTESVGAHN